MPGAIVITRAAPRLHAINDRCFPRDCRVESICKRVTAIARSPGSFRLNYWVNNLSVKITTSHDRSENVKAH